MMVHCVEQRFGDMCAPRKVQWLTNNGSIFAAYRALEIAAALNLEPCFTTVESPESNGMAEAFVKTFKRDYIRVNPIADARTALRRIDNWMENYDSEHPHSRGLPLARGGKFVNNSAQLMQIVLESIINHQSGRWTIVMPIHIEFESISDRGNQTREK
ncbi:integrase core domain-containing protein [Bradyrhizobium sp. UFLA05-109]